MARARRIAIVTAVVTIFSAAAASAQFILNNTPIQSITVTQTGSPGPVTVGGQKFFRAQATLTDSLSTTRLLGGGGSAFWNVAWSPSISVGNCGTTATTFGSQTISIDNAGVFHESWSPGTPNTLKADGLMTMPTGTSGASMTASLACGNGAATGAMSATWNGERYEGTYSFNGVNGIITVTGLTWSSSDPSIATVDNRGVVTGVAEGDVLITATFGSLCWQTEPGTASCGGTISGSIPVHVDPAPSGGGGGGGGGGGAPITAGPDRVVECASPSGTPVTMQGQLLFVPDFPITLTWTGPFGAASGATPTVPLPLGVSNVVFTISDGTRSASDSATITVNDTIAPQIGSVSATPSVIWPPNGRMVPATLAVSVSDACDAQLGCQIISVTGNDGATAADWQITGPLSLLVRAARSGGGAGRTYTATVECADDSGNKQTKTVEIVVPHDRGK